MDITCSTVVVHRRRQAIPME